MSQRTASSCPSHARYNGAVMLERDPQAWVLKALREAGGSLLSELYGLDEDELRWRPSEGEWSLKEIAAHLRDAEELALAQLNAFASGGTKPLPAWDVDVLPQERDYQGEEIDRLLAGFRALRRACRMRRAAELLAKTVEHTGQIGLRVGYEDETRFSREFRDFFRLCPRRFRELCRRSSDG